MRIDLTAVLEESLRPICFMKSTNCDALDVYSLPLERVECGNTRKGDCAMGILGTMPVSLKE